MAVYVNDSPSPLRLATGDYLYGFEPRGYYPETSDLAVYITSGILTEYDSIPDGSELASRQTLNVGLDVATSEELTNHNTVLTEHNSQIAKANADTLAQAEAANVAAAATLVQTDDGTNELHEVVQSAKQHAWELEHHFHNQERWMAQLAVPIGTTDHASNDLAVASTAFSIIPAGGAGVMGNWLQILGSSDTPLTVGNIFFDIHRLFILSTTANGVYYKIQIAHGDTGDEAVTAGDYTETLYWQNNQTKVGPIELWSIRYPVGTLVWARCADTVGGGGALNFYYGLHEYEAEPLTP